MNDLPKRKIERYRELVSELGQHLTAKQWKKAHSRLARTTLLFQQCIDTALRNDRQSYYKKVCLDLDLANRKLGKLLQPKGLSRVPYLLQRKLIKYSKNVEEALSESHEVLCAGVPSVTFTESGVSATTESLEPSPVPTPRLRETGTATEDEEMPDESAAQVDDPPTKVEGSPEYQPTPLVAEPARKPLVERVQQPNIVPVPAELKGNNPEIEIEEDLDGKAARERRKLLFERRDYIERNSLSTSEETAASGPLYAYQYDTPTRLNYTAVLLSLSEFASEDLEKETYLTHGTEQMILGACEILHKGWDDSAMLAKSLDLFKAAALDGSITAARFIGLFHRTGIAGDTNLKVARKWMTHAAVQGDPVACFVLGQMLEDGQGGPADLAEAAKLFQIWSFAAKAKKTRSVQMMCKYT